MTRDQETELLQLIAEVVDGALDDAGKDRLREILRDSAEARQMYRDHLRLHAELHLDYDQGGIPAGMPEIHTSPKVVAMPAKRRHWDWVFAIGAAAALLVFLTVIVAPGERGSGLATWEAEGEAVAVLTEALQAQWSGPAIEAGKELSPGLIELNTGLAQIEFFSGASVILQGPARLELVSAERAFLHFGKVRALVPTPAQGFVIEAKEFQTVDLGTEFAMEVNEAGGEVHVLDGEVKVLPNEANRWKEGLMLGGEGARILGKESPEAIALRPTEFVSREELQLMAAGKGEQRYQEWLQSTERIREREDVVLYFSFEDHRTWDRLLRSEVGERHGAVVGAQWTQGRFPGKDALQFRRISDRVRLDVPGEFQALTLASWVRVESFDQWLSSVMLTDGFDSGEVHWQISDSGELILGVSAAEPHNSFSPPVLSPRDLGRWIHIAVTANRGTGEVKHYLDGELVSAHETRIVEPFRIGSAEIGNWRSQDAKSHSLRSLNGTMDEFLILSSALSETEIHELYESGNPYR